MNGNRIHINDIGSYEIDIAKCGLIQLKMIVYPRSGNRYEIFHREKKIHSTNYLHEAIKKYNELVE